MDITLIRQKCVTVDEWEAGWQETERTDATCTDAGSVTYNNVNNTEITKTDEIPALGHSYDVTDTKEPTCTEKGSTTYTFGRCGDTYIEETTRPKKINLLRQYFFAGRRLRSLQ